MDQILRAARVVLPVLVVLSAGCGDRDRHGTEGFDLRVYPLEGSPVVADTLPGTGDVLVLAIALESGGNSVDVSSISFHASGAGDDASGIRQVRLYRDTDGDGVLGGGDGLLGISGGYGEDDGTVTFRGLTGTVPEGASVTWLLVYDLGAGAIAGDTFCASVLSGDDVTAAVRGRRARVRVEPEATRCIGIAWTSSGEDQAGAWFGFAVASAGDVDGDGFPDVLIGAHYYDTTATDAGKAYLFAGGPGGLSATPTWESTGDDQPGARYGFAVAAAGDVNGDGYDDVVVGAPLFDAPGPQAAVGKVYLYLGGPSGLSAGPAWTSSGDGQPGQFVGTTVGTAGDVDGDGYDDVITGGVLHDSPGPEADAGMAYVWLGGPSGLSASPAWTATGEDQAGAYFGWFVCTAGDVNADGFADVLVAAEGFDTANPNAGKAYLYLGSPGGPEAQPVWTSSGDDAAGTGFGFNLAPAGDVNGDGFGDILVGARSFDTTVTDAGKAYLYIGGTGGLSTTAAWTSSGDDQAEAGFGSNLASAGDVDGDGFSDVLVSASSYDGSGPDTGKVYLYRGGPAGLDITPAWTSVGEDRPGAGLGVCVAGLGDVDGDGAPEIGAGAAGYGTTNPNSGRVYIFSAGGP